MDKIGRILIVDDDAMVLEAMEESFVDEYNTVLASSGEQALEILANDAAFDTIILDIRMARIDGLKTADRIKEITPDIPIIFCTGFAGSYSQEDIERDYRPFDLVGKNEPPIRLRRAVRNAVTFHRLSNSQDDLIEHARREYGMVGRSRQMRDVYRKIERIGPTDSKTMILGPTGSGKELVAQALHRRSKRADLQMWVFSGAAKDPNLIEYDLFGHVKGAFTGAISDRVGLFERASGSTLFLDEIGDLDPNTQTKILRVLETGELVPVGGSDVRRVDVRLICATHHELSVLVEQGKFRQDLYYRLKGVTIRMPALRDRREDIPDLIDYFIERYCKDQKIGLKVFEPAARALLIEFDWPGSVRQLQDTIESLIALAPGYYITQREVADYLRLDGPPVSNGDGQFADQVTEFKRALIITALDRNRKNIAATARDLSLDQSNLRKMIKSLNISTS